MPRLEGGDDGAELGVALHAAQSTLDHEFAITERLDSKARTLLTGAGAWFAIAVGITGALLTRPHPPARSYDYPVLALALVSVGLLIATGVYVFKVWKLQDEEELAPLALIEMRDAALDPDDELRPKLVAAYANLLASKRDTNKTRADALHTATVLAGCAGLAVAAELVAVVVAAVFG